MKSDSNDVWDVVGSELVDRQLFIISKIPTAEFNQVRVYATNDDDSNSLTWEGRSIPGKFITVGSHTADISDIRP